MSGNEISTALRNSMPIDIEYFAKFPDFLAFGLTMACTRKYLINFTILFYKLKYNKHRYQE